MKEFGFLLISFSVIQTYLWIFGVINLTEVSGQVAYCIVIGVELVTGLLAAKIIKPI